MTKALHVILISLGLALIFNFLFFGKLIGISVFIFAVILIGAVSLFGLHQQISLRKTWWLILLIVFFALMPSLRDNEFLTFLNICAILGLLMLLAHELAGTPTFLMRLRDYIILITLVPLRMLGRAVSTVTLLGQIYSNRAQAEQQPSESTSGAAAAWPSSYDGNAKHRDKWVRVIKGAIMAVPIMIIFGVLFSQADLAFSQFIKGFIDITISERTIQYFVLLCFAFVASLSFLSYIFFPKKEEAVLFGEQVEPKVDHGKGIEVMVFLGLISTLFLVFIGFQITYLFGGEANIINAGFTPTSEQELLKSGAKSADSRLVWGFTYAEYARQGFWELLAVAILSLLVLLASEKYAGVESKRDKRFLIPALLMIAEVVIVIISAFKRLTLYIDAYGMTEQRFYGAGFIMLLLVLFILLAAKLIKSKREEFFAFGTLLAVATFIAVVNLINPDAFIARSNLEQYNRTGKIDVKYFGWLSADAEPWKIKLYKKLEGEDKAVLREWLEKEKVNLEKSSGDWQSANLSRVRALKQLYVLE